MISDSVVSQMQSELEPLKKRQDDFESLTSKRFEDMASAFANLEQRVAASTGPSTSHAPPSVSAPPAPPQPGPPSHTGTAPGSSLLPSPTQDQVTDDHDVREIIEKAERTIGFQPLTKQDVEDMCRTHNTSDTDFAMKMLVIEYLTFEMKNQVTKAGNIVRVFPPAKENWNTLYAEFDTRTTAKTVFGFTRFLRNNDHRVNMYIPHMFYNQFQHLNSIAYKYRIPPSNHKTRINFGNTDMYLQVKSPGSHVWKVVPITDLPPLTTGPEPAHLEVSPSPAPGRKRPSFNKRTASSSPELSRVSKVTRPALPPSVDHGDDHEENESARNISKDTSVIEDVSKPADNFL